VQENRLLTPLLFSLLLLIVFFIWVNVMVAIISEVYQQECDAVLNMQIDDDFGSMEPEIEQPQNDLKAMRYHTPVLADPSMHHPKMLRLTPDKCAAMPCWACAPGFAVCGCMGAAVGHCSVMHAEQLA
jgi:hypothetical protein